MEFGLILLISAESCKIWKICSDTIISLDAATYTNMIHHYPVVATYLEETYVYPSFFNWETEDSYDPQNRLWRSYCVNINVNVIKYKKVHNGSTKTYSNETSNRTKIVLKQ